MISTALSHASKEAESLSEGLLTGGSLRNLPLVPAEFAITRERGMIRELEEVEKHLLVAAAARSHISLSTYTIKTITQ